MTINGCDCSIVIKTANRELDIPYSDETLREAVFLLEEAAVIEGSGQCKAIRKNGGCFWVLFFGLSYFRRHGVLVTN